MLILKRKLGQTVTVTNVKTGEQFKIKLQKLGRESVELALDDQAKLFNFERDERVTKLKHSLAE